MAKAPVIEDAQMRHAFKVAGVTGQTTARDVALLHVLYGTGMTATEVAQLGVADVLDECGEFRRQSEVRAGISFNGRARPVFWVNTKVCAGLDAYFAERLKLGHGITAWRSQWRGLVQLGPVFLTSDGRPFTLTTRRTGAGDTSRSCESLTQVIRKLHDQAGIEAALQQALAYHEGKVLLVSSGGPISTAAGLLLNLQPMAIIELNLRLRNSAVSEFTALPTRHVLLSWNSLAHLDHADYAGWVTYA